MCNHVGVHETKDNVAGSLMQMPAVEQLMLFTQLKKMVSFWMCIFGRAILLPIHPNAALDGHKTPLHDNSVDSIKDENDSERLELKNMLPMMSHTFQRSLCHQIGASTQTRLSIGD